MVDEDKDFIAKLIEGKASYHGQRHDTVMYMNRRVEKKNLLSTYLYVPEESILPVSIAR